jgi:hypothetical protein
MPPPLPPPPLPPGKKGRGEREGREGGEREVTYTFLMIDFFFTLDIFIYSCIPKSISAKNGDLNEGM